MIQIIAKQCLLERDAPPCVAKKIVEFCSDAGAYADAEESEVRMQIQKCVGKLSAGIEELMTDGSNRKEGNCNDTQRLPVNCSRGECISAIRIYEVTNTNYGSFDYTSFVEECVTPRVVCVLRGWTNLDLNGRGEMMRHSFSFEGLKSHCPDARVRLTSYDSNSCVSEFQLVPQTTDTGLVEVIDDVQRLHSSPLESTAVVFDATSTTLCLPILMNYTVPFMAANDYSHRVVGGICDWLDNSTQAGKRDCVAELALMFRLLGTERGVNTEDHIAPPFIDYPSMFVQHENSRCGEHVDPLQSSFVQVLHEGQKRWTVYIENGACYNVGTSRVTCATSGAWNQFLLEDINPSFIAQMSAHPSEAPIKQTFVSVKGDLVFIPPGSKHSVLNQRAALATSINWLDGQVWNHARKHQAEELSVHGQILLEWIDKVHERTGGAAVVQSDVSWAEWVKGVGPASERIPVHPGTVKMARHILARDWNGPSEDLLRTHDEQQYFSSFYVFCFVMCCSLPMSCCWWPYWPGRQRHS